MNRKWSRRSALSLAVAATTVAAGAAPVLAQGSLSTEPGQKLPPGISRKALGKRESWIPAYKSVEVHDIIFQPGAKSGVTNMPCDMLCQVTEGELRITKKAENAEFTAKEGDVWTCRKGDDEAAENTGKTVAIMRSIFLMT
jgi:quercetin dioxygenase-like cupin family protein